MGKTPKLQFPNKLDYNIETWIDFGIVLLTGLPLEI
jgi:hypothetical protein